MTLVPSSTQKNAVSVQLCGEVTACKVVETLIRGARSVYMGDRALDAYGEHQASPSPAYQTTEPR